MSLALSMFAVVALTSAIDPQPTFGAPESNVATAERGAWTSSINLSGDDRSWFPDIAAGPAGRVHVIWTNDRLEYRGLSGGIWSPSVTIVPSGGDIFRSAIAGDPQGMLHLFYYNLSERIGFYQHASGSRAGSGQGSWSGKMAIGANGAGYQVAITAQGQGVVHAAYVDRPRDSLLSDTFYRRSRDGGRTWSSPVNLSASPGSGSTHPQIIADDGGVLHVSWDEGFDNATGRGSRATSRYRSSLDGGKTWSRPCHFGSPDRLSVQLVVTSTGAAGERLAVWRSQTDADVFSQTSSDGGESWSDPRPIPGIRPRPFNSPWYDQYALVTDRTRGVHLVLVGREPADDGWKVLHLRFSDSAWSAPHVVFDRPGLLPEYPRAVVDPSNRLHAVWFTRADLWKRAAMNVWYSSVDVP